MNLLFIALTISLGIYILFVIFFLSGLYRIKQNKYEVSDWPLASIVIPARNEEKNLPNIFQDLAQLDYPKNKLEIILVDDRSTDNTGDLMDHFCKKNPNSFHIKIADRSKTMTPKKHALTKGIDSSNGEYILSTDADCRIPPGWVKSMVKTLHGDVGIVVGASSIDHLKHSSLIHYQLIDFLALVAANAGAIGWGFSWTGTGQNLAYKRTFFDEIGGFHPVKDRVSGDDIYLVQAIGGRYGSVFNSDPASFVKTQPVEKVGEFISQRIRWSSNSRYAARTDLFFLFFLLNAFILNASFFIALFNPATYVILPMIFGFKFISDALVIFSGAAKLHIQLPSIMFIVWSILQPVYIPLVGLGGLIGKFKWKP